MTVSFGLNDAKVATWNSASNWASAVDLYGVQQMEITVNTINGTLEGDDQILDAHAKIISVNMRVRFAFSSLSVLGTITGITVTDSGSVETMTFDADDMPYFGMCGKINETSGGGDRHFFVPKMKIMEGFSVGGEYGNYMTPEVQGMGLRDSDEYGFLRIYKHDTAQAVTIPPT